jgi:hypothetical protein
MQNPMTFDEGTKRLKSFRDGMVRYYQELGDLLTLDSFKDVLIPVRIQRQFPEIDRIQGLTPYEMSAEHDYQVFYPQVKFIIEVGIRSPALQKWCLTDNT